jgi:DnaJ domain
MLCRTQWHTYEAGMPLLLGFVPLPRGLVCGLLEPAAGFAIGAYLYNRSDDTQLLGTWLMLSGATLFVLEARMRGRRRQRIQGFGDAVIESEDLARRAQNFGRPQPGPFAGWRRGREAREQEQRRRQEEAEARSRQQQQEQERQERERQERQRREQDAREAWRDPTAGRMTPEQALEILELKAGATEQDIRAAYNRLMQKVHPDTGGSTFFAKQLNLAERGDMG